MNFTLKIVIDAHKYNNRFFSVHIFFNFHLYYLNTELFNFVLLKDHLKIKLLTLKIMLI